MKTKLINYRTYNLDRAKVIPIDRRSIFGNQFVMDKDGTREEVIEKYKYGDEHRLGFYDKIENDILFRDCIQRLEGKTLGCWCTPLPCHGDVIIEYLENLD